jgi:hypothetical protein
LALWESETFPAIAMLAMNLIAHHDDHYDLSTPLSWYDSASGAT